MKIRLNNVRLAFPQLWEAKTVNGEGTPGFSATFLLPLDHPQMNVLQKTIEAVAEEKWGDKAPAILKQLRAQDKALCHNGDLKTQYDGFEGTRYINARNTTRPLVIDRDKTPLISADGRPYAGCYVNALIDVWAQDNNYGKRINASLQGIQFFADGDAFSGGGIASEDDFDSCADLSAAAEEESLV